MSRAACRRATCQTAALTPASPRRKAYLRCGRSELRVRGGTIPARPWHHWVSCCSREKQSACAGKFTIWSGGLSDSMTE
eukprot:4882654-Prymnesium_polylepis.1